ncbi:MAG: alanine racemase, partial [Actinobacteria bacterium]|nr:alanine racemase [Actinomycetota bacterium]
PALVVDGAALRANLEAMSSALPGARLRPHIKAHKCTALAKEQLAMGHPGLTCATVGEAVGLVEAGIDADILIANETLDAARLGPLVEAGHRITLAIDSGATLTAARAAGVRDVVVDVNVGLPRCGVAPERAGELADAARAAGLEVRGVMGYEGQATAVADRAQRADVTETAMEMLVRAHADVGGEIVSAGATANFDQNTVATEIQAGSYVFMDAFFGTFGLPFTQSLFVLSTVLSVNRSDGYAVGDAGLKSFGMDHGDPSVVGRGKTWFLSDEHITFSPGDQRLAPGDRIRITPGHIDPTVAYHEWISVVDGDDVVERWPVDLRGW